MKDTILGLSKDMKYYFCQTPVNMGKGIDKLCGFIRSNLNRDPFSTEVFVFISQNKKQIKILHWDGMAFILYTVKLYNGRLFRPKYDSSSGSFYIDWNTFTSLVCKHEQQNKYVKKVY